MSDFLRINLNDIAKGFVVTILAVVLGALQQAVNEYGLDVLAYDWSSIVQIAITSGIAYLSKNLLSDSEGKVLGKI